MNLPERDRYSETKTEMKAKLGYDVWGQSSSRNHFWKKKT